MKSVIPNTVKKKAIARLRLFTLINMKAISMTVKMPRARYHIVFVQKVENALTPDK